MTKSLSDSLSITVSSLHWWSPLFSEWSQMLKSSSESESLTSLLTDMPVSVLIFTLLNEALILKTGPSANDEDVMHISRSVRIFS